MASYQTHDYIDSDADDEGRMSPTLGLGTDSYADYSSHSDSEAMSTDHTPTSYSHRDGSPRGLVTEWSAEQVADFISSLGLPQYADQFVEEAIIGETLTTLLHSDLKEMGISSIGHRLTILRSTYDLKIKQNVAVEPEHFVPLSAESETLEPPTHDDISHIIRIIKDRDHEMRNLRDMVEKLLDENRKLREEVLPLVKQAKDRSQPLPTPEEPGFAAAEVKMGSGVARKPSMKKFFLSHSGPKNPSPTIQERDPSNLEPINGTSAPNHLTASIRDATSPAIPSPTSPGYQPSLTSNADGRSRGYSTRTDSTAVDTWTTGTYTSEQHRSRQADPPLSGNSLKASSVSAPANATPVAPSSSSANPSSSSSNGPPSRDQVEIFKSFRVSIDDPCHKVLPVALKKYNITADWRQYALYIVHGDQERCLGLNEKPLILFKQLDREGRKPMFMLRKHATPAEGHYTSIGGGAGLGQAIPGGVL